MAVSYYSQPTQQRPNRLRALNGQDDDQEARRPAVQQPNYSPQQTQHPAAPAPPPQPATYAPAPEQHPSTAPPGQSVGGGSTTPPVSVQPTAPPVSTPPAPATGSPGNGVGGSTGYQTAPPPSDVTLGGQPAAADTYASLIPLDQLQVQNAYIAQTVTAPPGSPEWIQQWQQVARAFPDIGSQYARNQLLGPSVGQPAHTTGDTEAINTQTGHLLSHPGDKLILGPDGRPAFVTYYGDGSVMVNDLSTGKLLGISNSGSAVNIIGGTPSGTPLRFDGSDAWGAFGDAGNATSAGQGDGFGDFLNDWIADPNHHAQYRQSQPAGGTQTGYQTTGTTTGVVTPQGGGGGQAPGAPDWYDQWWNAVENQPQYPDVNPSMPGATQALNDRLAQFAAQMLDQPTRYNTDLFNQLLDNGLQKLDQHQQADELNLRRDALRRLGPNSGQLSNEYIDLANQYDVNRNDLLTNLAEQAANTQAQDRLAALQGAGSVSGNIFNEGAELRNEARQERAFDQSDRLANMTELSNFANMDRLLGRDSMDDYFRQLSAEQQANLANAQLMQQQWANNIGLAQLWASLQGSIGGMPDYPGGQTPTGGAPPTAVPSDGSPSTADPNAWQQSSNPDVSIVRYNQSNGTLTVEYHGQYYQSEMVATPQGFRRSILADGQRIFF